MQFCKIATTQYGCVAEIYSKLWFKLIFNNMLARLFVSYLATLLWLLYPDTQRLRLIKIHQKFKKLPRKITTNY